tara:strand:- start:3504 stop:4793 length:1290 start_codon:yes stop_codon:yes gene_type:complete
LKISAYYNWLNKLLCVFLLTYILVPGFISVNVGFFELSASRVAFILLLVFWLRGLIFTRSVQKILQSRLIQHQYFFKLIFLFFMLQWVMVFQSVDFSWSFKRYLNFFIYNFFLILITASIPLQENYVKEVVRFLLIAVTGVILIAIAEILMGTNPFLPFINLESLNEFQRAAFREKLRGGDRRIQATFSHPLSFGQFVVLIIPVLIFFKKELLTKSRVYILIFFLVCVALFIKSRAVLVILILWGGYAFGKSLLSKKVNPSFKVLMIMGILLGGLVFLNTVNISEKLDEYFGGRELLDDDNRTNQIEGAWAILEEHLLTGVGFGKGVEELGYGTSGGARGTIDNYFLTLILDSGILVLGSFLLILLYVYFKYFKVRGNSKWALMGLIFFSVNLISLSLIEVHTLFYFLLTFTLIYNAEAVQSGYYTSQL